MGRLFGTDGVRGRANDHLTAQLALDISLAAAKVLGDVGAFEGHRPTALVGRDPRASGEFLEAAVVAGLASAGVDVVRLGVVPTPAVAHLVAATNADLGVMLSASHNPMADNGIKLFARGGAKLDDSLEDAIEAILGEPIDLPQGAAVGRIRDDFDLADNYVDHLVNSLGSVSLKGLKVVVDCAEGAAYQTAVQALTQARADVVAIHADPNGLNINDNCGSTHLEDLQAAVTVEGADLGIALDGDADRCLAVDAAGNVIDGDQILAVLALGMKDEGKLVNDMVVATVMSNLGFIQAMEANGIRVDQTKVGDRYVLESMKANGFTLGGEQSGHVVMSEFATTGDGVLTALHLMGRMAVTGRTLAELGGVMTKLPQVLINVSGVDKSRAGIDPELVKVVQAESRDLGSDGRVLLRPSGTEQLVRVMVEARSNDVAHAVAERLVAAVRLHLAL